MADLSRTKNLVKKTIGADTNGSQSKELPKFETDAEFPEYIPQDLSGLAKTAKQYDTSFYNDSDADFASRHPGLLGAEKMFESSVAADQRGNSELTPAIQNAFLTSGLEGAMGSFGNLGTTLKPGSAAEASVGRSLAGPGGILGFQQMNRANREKSLGLAETLFPRRQIGFGGETAVNIEAGNRDNENIYAQGEYQDEFARDKSAWEINAENIRSRIQQGNVDAQAGATDEASKKAASAQRTQAAIAGGAVLAGALIVF